MKIICMIAVLGLGSLFSGCASTKSISPAERATVKSVSLNPVVPMPAEVYYFSQAQALAGGLAGPIGGAIGAAGESENQKAFTAILERSGLDMPKELSASFAAKLKQKGVVVSEHPAGNQFELQVRLIGLAVPNGFYSSLRPVLVVVAILKDSSGKVIFQNNASCMNLSSKTNRHTLEKYQANPELLAEEYRAAINAVADDLVKDFMAGASTADPAQS